MVAARAAAITRAVVYWRMASCPSFGSLVESSSGSFHWDWPPCKAGWPDDGPVVPAMSVVAFGSIGSDVLGCVASDAQEPPISLFMHKPNPHMTRHGSTVSSSGAMPAATSQFPLSEIHPITLDVAMPTASA